MKQRCVGTCATDDVVAHGGRAQRHQSLFGGGEGHKSPKRHEKSAECPADAARENTFRKRGDHGKQGLNTKGLECGGGAAAEDRSRTVDVLFPRRKRNCASGG